MAWLANVPAYSLGGAPGRSAQAARRREDSRTNGPLRWPAAAGLIQTTAHSARVGAAAQDLAADNTELPAIMLAGGWRPLHRESSREPRRHGSPGTIARSFGSTLGPMYGRGSRAAVYS